MAGDRITTPIDTYTHPEYGSQIDLVGMIHIAQPHYYRNIQTIVDGKDPETTVVHYEKIKQDTPEAIQVARPSTLKKAERIKDMLSGVYGLFDDVDLDLAHQLKALQYRPHWQNHDATALEMLRRINRFTLARHVAAVGLLGKVFDGMNQEQKQEKLMSALSILTEPDASDGSKDKKRLSRVLFGSLDGAVLDYRNGIALNALDQQQRDNPEADMVLLWGMAHLKGLGEGLIERGFKKEGTERIVAIDSSTETVLLPGTPSFMRSLLDTQET